MKINPYYVGSSDIAAAIGRGTNSGVTFSSLDDAIAKAGKKITMNNSDIEVVVKIVRVIRRSAPPMVVQTVDEFESE